MQMNSVRVLARGVLVIAFLLIAGIVTAAAGLWLYAYSANHWTPPAIWVSLTLFTALTFGPVAVQFRRCWRRTSLWAALVTLLALHIVAYTLLLTMIPDWRLPWLQRPR